MSLFIYSEEESNYAAEINGVQFVCEEVKSEFEKAAPALADAYKE